MVEQYSALKPIDTLARNLRAQPIGHPLNEHQFAGREGFKCKPDNPFVIIPFGGREA